ncbi:unnamed protein product [Allacma fusca]|uniref:Integrase catalytic domain-containing protein n=1 Tax=Allacma fusca TaxID=39272 RepID=A0A8J2JJN7_9HEXA|nr:unnamed protein product [Allacma fusca]
MARLFDPLKWLAPVCIKFKIMFQDLWKNGQGWDDVVPPDINAQWDQIKSELPIIEDIRIPRSLSQPGCVQCELQGFSDASEVAYGAVVYLRTISSNGTVQIRLICSKTKVAPVKKVSLPRLELCGALLLTNLMELLIKTLAQLGPKVYCWTDSTIVLHWIRGESNRWQTFVANRVSRIQDSLPIAHWHHVRGKENPADCISRGILPAELLNHPLWWTGPSWLSQETIEYPTHQEVTTHPGLLEAKYPKLTVAVAVPENSILSQFSCLKKVMKITAICRRFSQNCKGPKEKRNIDAITPADLEQALFVHVNTHAIHLELKEDMTTEACLAAIRAFIGRRGKPSEIHSDCGTNLKGASNEMKAFLEQIATTEFTQSIGANLAQQGILWMFNPPHSPHFGGIWEAAVKSAKYHLRRVTDGTTLTRSQYHVLLAQIEGVLNSRPLCPMSSDPSDLQALTPGHFLIGRPIISFPEPDLQHLPDGRLPHWQRVQQLSQQFWNRWSKEVIGNIQKRPKWQIEERNVTIGSLVLLKEDNAPPLKCKLGRISALHPGADGLVRVVTVRTEAGEFKRPIVKLSVLPVDI